MVTYGQYCPIARTAEILSERWTPLVVRNLLFGATTFTSIAHGVPNMSRSVLSTRLRGLEDRQVVVKQPTPDGPRYLLTEAGYDLATTLVAMADWGERWLEVTSDHADPTFALWAWTHVQMNHERLPDRRTVVELDFVDQRPSKRYWWLLIDGGRAEMCNHDPGGGHRAWVTAGSAAFCDWHRGVRTWTAALRAQDIRVTGPRRITGAIPTWHSPTPTLPPRSAVCATPAARGPEGSAPS